MQPSPQGQGRGRLQAAAEDPGATEGDPPDPLSLWLLGEGRSRRVPAKAGKASAAGQQASGQLKRAKPHPEREASLNTRLLQGNPIPKEAGG